MHQLRFWRVVAAFQADLLIWQQNVGHLLGLPASYLFKLSCFTQVLADDDEAAILRDSVENMPTTDADLQESGPAHFEMAGSGLPGTGLDGPQSRNEWLCWCTMHRPARAERPNLCVLPHHTIPGG